MLRREKIIYPALLAAIIVLAWTSANFYTMNNNQDVSIAQEQARILSSYALTINTQTHLLQESFQRYYQYVLGDQNTPNITQNSLYMLQARSFTLLSQEADNALYVIQTDESYLIGFHLDHVGNFSAFVNVYTNVSETINYAVNQLRWTLGRSPDDHQRMMFELCHILGADYNVTADTNQLYGISQIFLTIYVTSWNGANQNSSNLPVNETELEWALGNATELSQHLVTWHNSNPPTPLTP